MPGPHRPAIHETAVRGLRAGEEGVPGSEDALLVDGLEVHASAAWSAPWCRPAGGQEQATGQWPDVANRAEARTPGARGADRAAERRARDAGGVGGGAPAVELGDDLGGVRGGGLGEEAERRPIATGGAVEA